MRNRTRLIQIAAVVAVFVIGYIFFNSASHSTNFRAETERRLKRPHSILQGSKSDEEWLTETNLKLQEILAKHWEENAQPISVPGTQVSDPSQQGSKDGEQPKEISIAGRINAQYPQGSDGQTSPTPVSSPVPESSKAVKSENPTAGDDDIDDPYAGHGKDFAKEELASILKKSPMIIFSKSYCSFSKRAKMLLLQKYDINPKPYVVELDIGVMAKDLPSQPGEPTETLGREIQDLLATMTGRKTVPNILINSQSIGGADDVTQLDRDGKLIDLIKEKGGNRIVSVELKS